MGRCEVLGPIRAFDAEGRELTLASESQRRLLAILCLHAGTVVRSAVLEEELGLSAGALRTSISRLRRAIGPALLVTGPAGYELRAELDVVEYERLVKDVDGSDADPARQELERAGSLWRGVPYDEFAHEPWAEVEVHRLDDLHAAAMETLVVLLLDAGDETAAIDTLLPLIEHHPYRDRPRCLLMRALHQAGRTTEALRAFQAYRVLLRDDIGTEPAAAVVELDRAIVAGSDLAALRERGHPAWSRRRREVGVADPGPHRHLPTPISSFVGRARETADIIALLDDHRIVTLTGAGGSGKTRLALRVAAALSQDGADAATAWWIGLGVLAADGDVAEHVATQIGVVARRDPVAEVARRLRGRASLLVLDNAEHVINATAGVVADLLTRCPDARALVTSREPLGLPGEVVWRVPALGMPERMGALTLDDVDRHDAIRLFIARAREARPGMAIDRVALEHIGSICAELDGMPLALELAAARLRTLPLPTLARSVNEIMRWRGDRGQDPATRHRTLRASIDWSFALDRSRRTAVAGRAGDLPLPVRQRRGDRRRRRGWRHR